MATNKKARTHPPYELLYWPGIPGRGEFVRLVFEAAGVSYKDPANEPDGPGAQVVASLVSPDTKPADGNPLVFAPPALRVPGEGRNGAPLLIYQTPAILSYLGDKLDLAGEDEADRMNVLSYALTALDLNNEAHDTHHPVAVSKYYEDQKDEALKKATDFRENRIPKFLAFFERVLKANEPNGQAKFLVGSKLSYADTTVWNVLSGLEFAFPNEIKATKQNYPLLFGSFYENIVQTKGIKDYLESKRRLPFSMGVYRHYPELDRS